MGQQQLLLLVLGIVIVGLAVVVGIDAFNQNRRKAQVDVVALNLVRLAASAQTWKLTPAAMGGGQGAAGFTGVETGFDQLGWATVPRGVRAYDPKQERVRTMGTTCYRPTETAIYCPFPQLSGGNGDGQLVIFALDNVTSSTGDTPSSADMDIVALATVTGTGPDDVVVDVLR